MTRRAKTQAAQMRRSWLVQRLRKPHGGDGLLAGLDVAFSFGGGLVNGGLSPDAMDLLRQVFSFDYMGSSEFEWGAVPNALQGMAKDQDQLRATSVKVPLRTVPQDWRNKGDDTPPDGDATVYVISRKQHTGEVFSRILTWARAGWNTDTKESVQLSSTLRPYNEWDGETCGWLELDNGFFFFTDRQMFVSTADLFGLAVAS